MRALAAVLTLAVWSCRPHAHAQESPRALDSFPRALHSLFGIPEQSPVHDIFECSQTLGPTKCLSALSVWRAEKAVKTLGNGQGTTSNVLADVKEFPWRQYSNSSDDQLYSQLCDGAEKLLRYRPLSLSMIPGYTVELASKGNGTLNVDVLKNDGVSSRGNKLQKQFYNILPFLMVPGLIMSAILPFVLPALKLMVVGVGILNNMALSGAVFTLLRNNAFNDRYENKVIYVNDGYKNEKDIYYKEIPLEHVDVQGSDLHGVVDGHGVGDGYIVEEYPTNQQWITQYYGGEGAGKNRRSSQRQKYVKVKH